MGSEPAPGWIAYRRGETPLEFGSRYLFANPDTREIGIYPATRPPSSATCAIKLTDLLEQARAASPTPEPPHAD